MAENSLFGNKEYKTWVKELKERIRRSQVKASVQINSTMLELYWSIGADIVSKQAENKWGSSVIEQLSRDLRGEFPGIQGFSETNLRLMKRFFSFYSQFGTSLVPNSDDEKNQHQADAKIAPSSAGARAAVIGTSLLSAVPWRHHVEIFRHCDTLEGALFYIGKTVEEGWSRETLISNLKSNLDARQGIAPNNFAKLLPPPQSSLAGEMLKDPYIFDFIALRERYVEMDLEKALVANVTDMLLELGQGFAFLGEQVPVMAGSKELFIDLLLYHVKLHCYVIVELKAQEFDAAFTGQLRTYVAAVNHQMKTNIDNPTIGLLICKSKDNVYAEYSLESSSQPIGISAYELTSILPSEFKSALPSIEEIEATLKDE
jgi:predicted nuclease of restriction endonuclease-like (RecB) superfamily